jgi:hypothetical protein
MFTDHRVATNRNVLLIKDGGLREANDASFPEVREPLSRCILGTNSSVQHDSLAH